MLLFIMLMMKTSTSSIVVDGVDAANVIDVADDSHGVFVVDDDHK